MSEAYRDLQAIGTDCARSIQTSPKSWLEEVSWLQELPAIVEVKTEVDGEIVVHEDKVQSFGPVCMRLMCGFCETMALMNDGDREDRYV